MDELINLVAQKTGIPKDKAEMAVETVVKFLKQKLPGPIAGQIDGILKGGSLTDAAGKLGDLLGGKK